MFGAGVVQNFAPRSGGATGATLVLVWYDTGIALVIYRCCSNDYASSIAPLLR